MRYPGDDGSTVEVTLKCRDGSSNVVLLPSMKSPPQAIRYKDKMFFHQTFSFYIEGVVWNVPEGVNT